MKSSSVQPQEWRAALPTVDPFDIDEGRANEDGNLERYNQTYVRQYALDEESYGAFVK